MPDRRGQRVRARGPGCDEEAREDVQEREKGAKTYLHPNRRTCHCPSVASQFQPGFFPPSTWS